MNHLLYYLKGYGIHLKKVGPDTFSGLGDYKFIKSVIISRSNKKILLKMEESIDINVYHLDNLKRANDNLNILYGLEFLVIGENMGTQDSKNEGIPLTQYQLK